MNKPSLRQLGLTSLLLVMPFFLTGCSLKPTASGNSSTKQTLTVWRQPYDKKLDDPAFQNIINAFQAKNKNVTINYRSFESTDDYEAAVLNSLAAGQGPDVWEIRNDELARHIDKIVAYPAADAFDPAKFKQRYATSLADEMLKDGKLYGMPLGVDPLVLLANSDHLKAANQQDMPKTWQETQKLATTLTRKVNDTLFRPGLALGTASNIDRASQIAELFMLQTRTQMVDPAHRTATFDLYSQVANGQFDYPAQDALLFYSGFAVPQSGYQTWDASQTYSTRAFASGDLSMMINYLSVAPEIRKINPKIQIRVAPVPQIVTRTIPREDQPATVSDPVYTARYRALVVSKPWAKLSTAQQNAKRDLAWQFINFATAPANVNNYDQQLYLLPVQRVATTNNSGGVQGLAAQITPYLVTWYKGKSPKVVDQILSDMVRSITENGKDPGDMLHQAAQLVTTLLP